MEYLMRLVCLAIGYAFGIFQTSYIYGRLNGFDLRNSGSGNYGTTNMLRTKGLKAGLIVLLLDAFKCVFAVLLIRAVFANGDYAHMIKVLEIYGAAGVILGHNFPFYLGFKGGKGIAATAGLIISLGIYYMIPELILFAVVFAATHYVSLGSLCIYVLLVAETIFLGQNSIGPYAGVPQGELIEIYVVMLLLAVMAFVKHSENIKRLISGTERKTYLKSKKE